MGEDEDVFELPMSQRRTPRLFKAALSTFISNASSRVNLSADASSGPRSCGGTGHVSGCLVASRLPSLPRSGLLFALHRAEGREREKWGEERRG